MKSYKRYGKLIKPHGLSGTPEYYAWLNMKARCYRKYNRWYSHYGAIGIKVYKPWIDNFLEFYEYIGKKPSPEYSLDRIDSTGNYYPGNIRWSLPLTQSINQKINCRNKSGYRGVSWHKTAGKWRSCINISSKQVHLGLYTTKEEAAYVRDQFAAQLWGEDAKLNII